MINGCCNVGPVIAIGSELPSQGDSMGLYKLSLGPFLKRCVIYGPKVP